MSSLTHEILHWRTKNKKSLSFFQYELLLIKYQDFTKHAFKKHFNGKKVTRKPPVPFFLSVEDFCANVTPVQKSNSVYDDARMTQYCL